MRRRAHQDTPEQGTSTESQHKPATRRLNVGMMTRCQQSINMDEVIRAPKCRNRWKIGKMITSDQTVQRLKAGMQYLLAIQLIYVVSTTLPVTLPNVQEESRVDVSIIGLVYWYLVELVICATTVHPKVCRHGRTSHFLEAGRKLVCFLLARRENLQKKHRIKNKTMVLNII